MEVLFINHLKKENIVLTKKQLAVFDVQNTAKGYIENYVINS